MVIRGGGEVYSGSELEEECGGDCGVPLVVIRSGGVVCLGIEVDGVDGRGREAVGSTS